MNQLTLLELNQLVKATLDSHLDPSYWVIAEIAELRINQSGHCYLELAQKDHAQVVAKIRANIWSYTFRKLGPWFEGITGMPLKKGIKVLFNVQIQFHELYGMSLVVKDIDPNFTLGERARKRQETIQRLAKEALIEKNKKLSLPLVPQRVAVISSPTAAGYEDFLKQLKKNIYGYGFQVTLFKSVMQGAEAEQNIIRNLEKISSHSTSFDIVAVIRGGGSQVDMDCFDGYNLSKIVANMPLPVISGIGHERDESVLDLVAHTNLHTPTAVGEFLVNGIASFETELISSTKKLKQIFDQRVAHEQIRITGLRTKLSAFARNRIVHERTNLGTIKARIHTSSKQLVDKHLQNLDQLKEKVTLLDPNTILKRGYTITTINQKRITKGTKVKAGDEIKTYTTDRAIESLVKSITKRK